MSSTTRNPQPLQRPDFGADSAHRSNAAAADSSNATSPESLSADPQTDAVQTFKLRNSRGTMVNSHIHLAQIPSVSQNLPVALTSYITSPPLHQQDDSPVTTTTTTPFPPTVTLPSGESTPQRVDSGFEDQLSYKSPTRGLTSPTHTHPDAVYSPSSSLSPNIDSPRSNSNAAPSIDHFTSAALSLSHKSSAPSLKPISRTPSFKAAAFGRGFGSGASSRIPSPIITAMGDVTPLPSPLMSGDSPGPWKRLHARTSSKDGVPTLSTIDSESVLVTSNGESIASAMAHQYKRKGLSHPDAPGEEVNSRPVKEGPTTKIHTRNRSVSEYHPEHTNIPKRMITVSGSRPGIRDNNSIRREPHLSDARGLTPVEKPPSPPPSESSASARDSADSSRKPNPKYEYFDARGRKDHKLRRWRAVKALGQGTFSRVVLATSHVSVSEDEIEAESHAVDTGLLTPEPTSSLDRKALVAVKVCESGPKGGASEDRVEMSLKRELEIMQSIHHPSLVELKAWNIEPSRAILVLSYCPGGDLFDVATAHKALLVPSLLRRIFAEQVGAVRYLHQHRIIHRDIKLENVLVNLTPQELSDPTIDWQSYPYSVTTLTDLGLSRRVADDEKLQTRCGSEDYAAPEIIMGLDYDGRATDAWSLGVLLYALLESRLPFDPPPGMSDALRMRSRTSHRIARVEWQWIKYAGEDGDHDGDFAKFKDLGMMGAMEITEGLLKRARSRWPLEKVAETEWVEGGVQVEGGIKFREAHDGEEVS
ncbi:unnamed protein product [Discula destructiva]